MAKNIEIIAREVVRLGLADGQKVAKALADGKKIPFMPAHEWKALGYEVVDWEQFAFRVKIFNAKLHKIANTRIFSASQVRKVEPKADSQPAVQPKAEAPKTEPKAQPKVEVKAEPKADSPKKSWKPLSAKEELAKGWKPHVMAQPKAEVKTDSQPKVAPKVQPKAETRKTNTRKVHTTTQKSKATTRKAPVLKQNIYVENGIEVMHIAKVNGANRIVKETTLPKSVYDKLSKANKKALEQMVMA